VSSPQTSSRARSPDGRRRPRIRDAAYCLLGLLVAFGASGDDTAPLKPYLEGTVTHDDNVFRISDAVAPITVINSPERGDTFRTATVGLAVDWAAGNQRFVGNAAFSGVRYKRFTLLDFNGHDARGSWLWRVGAVASGEVGAADTYSLASFANLLAPTPDSFRLRRQFANGTFVVAPHWRVRIAADRLTQDNSDPALGFDNVTVAGTETAVTFVGAAGSSAGVRARIETGRFPNLQPVGAAMIDNAYRQVSIGPVVNWTPSAASRIVARAARQSRRYDQLPSRNFDVDTARLEYSWTPTPEISLLLLAQREISPDEYIRSSAVLVRGVEVRPTAKLSASLELGAALGWTNRRYIADPAEVLLQLGSRTDTVRTANILLGYRVGTHVAIQLSATHESRASNVDFGDYAANVVWLRARLTL
jgi:hypothetical protein